MEIVIADDGSGNPTREVLERMRKEAGLDIVHVWHEDDGFRKSEILNKGIVASGTDYLIFTDGDCIPRKDFVAVHVQRAREGHLLSGGYFKLPMDVSQLITQDDILAGRATDPAWLRAHGVGDALKMSKLAVHGTAAKILNAITPTKATWNGHNASGWKRDVLAVNGFDERMQYGGQDRELGERMMNSGIRPVQIRYSAVCVHLDHKRGYRTDESIARNRGIRDATARRHLTWTEHGIVKGPKPAAAQ